MAKKLSKIVFNSGFVRKFYTAGYHPASPGTVKVIYLIFPVNRQSIVLNILCKEFKIQISLDHIFLGRIT